MKAILASRALVLATASLVVGLAAGRAVQAQGGSVSTLAQMNLPVVPRHHHQIYFTYHLNNLFNPTTGNYIAFQLNDTGNDCPETLPLPPWINCGPGGDVLSPQPGVASGTVVARPTADGWTSYRFSVQVQGAFTQIWDASRQAKVAQGTSRMSLGVAYDLSEPLSALPDCLNPGCFYSVLGPKAHEADLNQLGIHIRNFSFTVDASGSGSTLPAPGRPATWQFAGVFLTAQNLALGHFSLNSR
jgi:hypothetical protein